MYSAEPIPNAISQSQRPGNAHLETGQNGVSTLLSGVTADLLQALVNLRKFDVEQLVVLRVKCRDQYPHTNGNGLIDREALNMN